VGHLARRPLFLRMLEALYLRFLDIRPRLQEFMR
jgi:hypothetical protein